MTPDRDLWAAITLARVPAAGLAALASVRHRPGVGVRADGAFAWVHWPAGRVEVAYALWPVPGVLFFRPDGEQWIPFGKRLPTSLRPPTAESQPVAGVIVPDRVTAVPPPTASPSWLRLGIVRGGPPRPATALACIVADLAAWADAATTRELGRVRAAVCRGRALLLGDALPTVPRSTRYWGSDVLTPVGFRPHPDLPPAVIREAVGATADEWVLLGEGEAELLPRSEFTPLSRPRVRLAVASTAGAP